MTRENETPAQPPRQKKDITRGDPLPPFTKFTSTPIPLSSFLNSSARREFPTASPFRAASELSVRYPKLPNESATDQASTQSQTQRGDPKNDDQQNSEKEDPYGDDQFPAEEADPSRPDKEKDLIQRPRIRKFTIEPGEFEKEFVLTESKANQKDLFKKIQIVSGFVNNVTNYSEVWSNAIRTMATSITTYQGQVVKLTRNVHAAKQKNASLT